jgi:PAS domain S-box-containing protein
MKAEEKSKEQLINELEELRQKIAELEAPEARSAKRAEQFAGARGEWERTFDVIPDPISILDRQYRIVWVNKTMANRLGMAPEEAVGLTCYECIHGMEKPPSFCPHTKLLADGEEHMVEIHEKRLGGDFIVSVSPLHDAEGRVIASIHVARDITERKQAEEVLRESEQRYRSLFKINHSVMLLIDPENADIVDANPAACSFYGWSREEITSMKITDINMLSKEQVFQEMERAKSEKRNHFFFRHRLANVETRDVEVYSGPIRLHGRELLYSIIHDITERKRAEEALQKSEQRYRHLAETMNEGLAMADQDYVFTYVNETFCEMLGYCRDELLGHNLIDFVDDDYKEFMKDQMARRRMGEAKRFELVWRTKNGHNIYTLVSPRGFFDAEGCFTGSLGVLTNITDRKQVEKALQKAHDRLEHRTIELMKLNKKLKQEIEDRKLAELELRKREAQLEIQTSELEEVNTALRVLLKRRDDDKTEFEEKVLYNVKELIVPYLQRLKGDELDGKRRAYVSIIESNLNDIVSSFTHKLSSKYLGLTPTEIQIANLVKQGMTTKEIAEILNSSHRTVEFHRKNIRKKIGIVNRKVNLRSHLLSM